MNTSSDERNPVELLAEEFLDRKRRGEKPTLREYIDHHPELAAEIRDLFPALLMVEDLGDSSGATTGSLAADAVAAPGIRLERLGDFRILREIGRGGMGVVYEAEQESLSRRVAVKVLSAAAGLQPKQLRRFEHEARAAARLHHTNIVPVFGVGRHDGHHYYVMQFIGGPGLDAVLVDLRRFRRVKTDSSEICEAATRSNPGPLSGPTAAEVAHSLVIGAFVADDTEPRRDSTTDAPDGAAAARASTTGLSVPPITSPSDVLAQASGLPATSDADHRYYRGVARIGIQAALALEYANRQGILHRDIKPSNLLLDARGHVWVADFGLAKSAEPDDLTESGDIVGTIRYMAPERFRGQCDARSDVYSLGLTLYEMVALRPAYEAPDRHALIERVLSEEPARLAKLAPGVPRDLETIIAKAISREPETRYSTAGALADDLERFVDDRPIAARRVSAAERLARWCRRNVAIAALIGLAALLLVAVAAISTVGYLHTWTALDRERSALARERDALAGERLARQEAVDNLYHARVGEARALRTARLGGYRTKVLDLLAGAGRLDTHDRDFNVLRREASASLGDFAGLTPILLRDLDSASYAIAIHPRSEWIAAGLADGTVRLYDPATGGEHARLSEPGAPVTALAVTPDGLLLVGHAEGTIRRVALEAGSRTLRTIKKRHVGAPFGRFHLQHDGTTKIASVSRTTITIRDVDGGRSIELNATEAIPGRQGYSTRRDPAISPDGRLVAAAVDFPDTPHVELVVWELAAPSRPRHVSLTSLSGYYECAFSQDSTRVAIGGDLAFVVFDTADLNARLTVSLDSAMALGFGPDGKTLAVGTISRQLKIWSLTTNRELAELKHVGSQSLRQVALSADGRTLASTTGESVSVWNLAATGERIELAGHASGVPGVTFSPDGKTLASASKDQTVKLWDTATGQLRHTLGDYPMDVQICAFSPGGELLATGSDAGVRFWDVQNRRAIDTAIEDPANTRTITGLAIAHGAQADFAVLLTARAAGFGIWRLKRPADARTVLEPVMRSAGDNCFHLAMSPDCRLAAYIHNERLVRIQDLATLQSVPFSGPQTLYGWHSLAFRSPNELVYISADRVAVVWDVRANQLARTIGQRGVFDGFHIAVSRDGRWLAAEATPSSVAVVDLERGEVVYTFREERSPIWSLAWSPDSRRLAVGLSDGGVVLWDLERVRDVLEQSEIGAPSILARQEEPGHARSNPVLDIDRIAALTQPDVDLARAAALAYSSNWQEAAAAMARALAGRAAENPLYLFEHAILRLAVGDAAGHRAACLRILDGLRKHNNRLWLEFAAHAHVLAPGETGDTVRALRLAKARQTYVEEVAWSEHVLGLAFYRAGQAADAHTVLREASQRDPTWRYRVMNWLVLAMADWRLGKHGEARRWLEQAERWVESELRGRPGGIRRAIPQNWEWRDGILLHLLLDQARAVVKTSLPNLPDNVFARPELASQKPGQQ
jgi:serine/threonine protein kinase/WD40 repeat protein